MPRSAAAQVTGWRMTLAIQGPITRDPGPMAMAIHWPHPSDENVDPWPHVPGDRHTHVAMEATGVYWNPAWNLLEASFEFVLARGTFATCLPGHLARRLDDVRLGADPAQMNVGEHTVLVTLWGRTTELTPRSGAPAPPRPAATRKYPKTGVACPAYW
jgi:hypothetical protein